MSEEKAIVITSFEGSNVSDDGGHGLFKFKSDTSELILAIPNELLMPVMAGISNSSGKSAKILNKDPNVKHIFPCEWWEFGPKPDSTSIIMSFKMPGGAEMSFEIGQSSISNMIEVLQNLSGETSQVPSGTIKQ